MEKIYPHVLSQGCLDGACLLYSIMNAHKTLTGKKSTKEWVKLISIVPSPTYYLDGNGSVVDSDVSDNLTEKIILSTIINSFKLFKNAKFSVEVKDIIHLKGCDYKNSVFIFCVAPEKLKSTFNSDRSVSDHWVCAVGKNKDSLLVQCSIAIHNTETKNYYEEKMLNERHYNESFSLNHINKKNIFSNMVYKISLVE